MKNDGARYDPSTDTWTAMTPEFPPSARRKAIGAWTGSELIVWGGDSGAAALATGGRYAIQVVCGTGGCQRSGSSVCSGGVVSYQCVPQPPSPEVCDGLDNDCNTLVDDGIPPPNSRPFLMTAKLDAVNNQWSWGAVPDATAYDFTRGNLNALRLSGGQFSGTAVECLANDTPAASYQDSLSPAVGDSFWYLVRPVNACSGHGTYDDNVARDASINLSPTACP